MRGRRGLAALTLLLLSACGDPPATQPGQEETPAADPVLFVPVTEPDHPDVLVRSGAASRLLQCEGAPSLGSTGMNFGAPPPAQTPEQALRDFTEQGLFPVPRGEDGYEHTARQGDRYLYEYLHTQRVRVAVVIARAGLSDQVPPGDGYGVESFAMCDPSEYGLPADDPLMRGVWYDAEGRPVPTDVVQMHPGPAHCDWQTVTFLYLDDRQYLRDPDGVLRRETTSAFDPDAALPADAEDTGYRRDEARLWRDRDGSAVYVVRGDTVERWPAAREMFACA